MSSPSGIYVDTANNRLYAANPGNGSIVVFNNASTATGNIAPDRTVLNSGVPLLSQGGITGDVTRDLLYVAEAGSIFVLENASTMPENSPPPVIRTVTMTVPLNFTYVVSVDASRDRLYAATSTSVLAFNNASTLTGSPSPDSTIGGLVTPAGLFVDSTRDLLYVSEQGTSLSKSSVRPVQLPRFYMQSPASRILERLQWIPLTISSMCPPCRTRFWSLIKPD